MELSAWAGGIGPRWTSTPVKLWVETLFGAYSQPEPSRSQPSRGDGFGKRNFGNVGLELVPNSVTLPQRAIVPTICTIRGEPACACAIASAPYMAYFGLSDGRSVMAERFASGNSKSAAGVIGGTQNRNNKRGRCGAVPRVSN
ncbi:uncharacterized protein VTP21DRAFT_7351 [Calcarisporiella thermophila]|uniref:uncharacterized protein n=1 Tax=Calcarisporiella thermophila TaxID=911321 RepID=UPI003743CC38